MNKDDARELLSAAVDERDATATSAEQARLQLYDVICKVAPTLRQVDIVRATGWTREYIRRIVDDTRNDEEAGSSIRIR